MAVWGYHCEELGQDREMDRGWRSQSRMPHGTAFTKPILRSCAFSLRGYCSATCPNLKGKGVLESVSHKSGKDPSVYEGSCRLLERQSWGGVFPLDLPVFFHLCLVVCRAPSHLQVGSAAFPARVTCVSYARSGQPFRTELLSY